MTTAEQRLGVLAGLVMMGWLSLVLWLDRADGGGGLGRQRVLGLLTWTVLAVVLTRVGPLVRAQTLVVVAVATAFEFVFSPTLHVYAYRFDNVPAYVPPGHGLVYLSAFAVGHAAFVRRRPRLAGCLVLVAGGAWALHGLFLAERPDVLGAFWFACLAGFVAFGPSTEVYVGAFVVVSWLELAGTALGTWEWAARDFTGWVPMGNPPSGAAGGYGWFDLAALLVAPVLVRRFSRRRLPEPPRPAPGAVVR